MRGLRFGLTSRNLTVEQMGSISYFVTAWNSLFLAYLYVYIFKGIEGHNPHLGIVGFDPHRGTRESEKSRKKMDFLWTQV